MPRHLMSYFSRFLAVIVLFNLLWLLGCGGDAGLKNGAIVGRVFSNINTATAQANNSPLAGVSVVASRENGTPALLRSTTTDGNGNFAFADLPDGQYVVGFAKNGFQPITTQAGATSQRTAIGSQIRLIVESGLTSVAPDVTMIATIPTGNATVVVTVVDAFTNQPVTHALVKAGPVVTTQNTNGVYTLSVPIVNTSGDPFNLSANSPVNIDVSADGYNVGQGGDLQDVFPGQTRPLTVPLQPRLININGFYKFSTFQNLVSLITPTINLQFQGGSFGTSQVGLIVNNGTWQITGIPVSNTALTRQVNIIFSHPDLQTFTLSNIVVPRNVQNLTITNPVILQALTMDVTGQVFVTRGTTGDGTQAIPNGANDRVIIRQTGQTASVINGQYLIPNVPVQQGPTDAGYIFDFVVTDPSTGLVKCGQTAQPVKPILDTPNGGPTNPTQAVFVVPPVTISTVCSSGS
jgi:hypothetical protein